MKYNRLIKFIALLWSSLVAVTAYADGVHFSTTKFVSEYWQGNAIVNCHQGGRQYSTLVNCDETDLSPGDFAYLHTDDAVDADQVKLTNKVGKHTVTQSSRYDVKNKRSKSAFNLWIWTLTQSGLLDFGVNHVAYEFSKSKKPAGNGTFDVAVEAGRDHRCPQWTIYSGNFMDCQNPSQNVCNEYFRQVEPYCR